VRRLHLKLAWAGLFPWRWWAELWGRLFFGQEINRMVMVLPVRREKTMDTMTETKSDTDLRLELEKLLNSGRKRLTRLELEADARRMQETVERCRLWGQYNDQVISGLPEVLRPYARRFSEPLYPPDFESPAEKIGINLDDLNASPLLVYLHHFGGPEGKWEVDFYRVPGIERYTDEWKQDRVVWLWDPKESGYEGCGAVDVPDLDIALARACRQFSRMELLKKQLVVTVDDALVVEREGPEQPEYQNVDEMGDLVADKAVSSAIRAIVRDEMYRPEPK
jgi:hypothetical protein